MPQTTEVEPVVNTEVQEQVVPTETQKAAELVGKAEEPKVEVPAKEDDTLKQKAQAFDALVKDASFIQWYNEKYSVQTTGVPPRQAEFELTPEQLNEAISDPAKFRSLVVGLSEDVAERKYGGRLKELDELKSVQNDTRLEMEFGQLERDHPDLWKIDKAGILEPFLYYYSDLGGQPLAIGYREAKKVYDLLLGEAKNMATGIVQGAKQATTESPSTSSQESGVVWVDSQDEAKRLAVEAALEGRKIEIRVKRHKT